MEPSPTKRPVAWFYFKILLRPSCPAAHGLIIPYRRLLPGDGFSVMLGWFLLLEMVGALQQWRSFTVGLGRQSSVVNM